MIVKVSSMKSVKEACFAAASWAMPEYRSGIAVSRRFLAQIADPLVLHSPRSPQARLLLVRAIIKFVATPRPPHCLMNRVNVFSALPHVTFTCSLCAPFTTNLNRFRS